MEKGSTVYSFTYDPAGRPVSISDGNTRYYYVLNQQGDVVGLMNSNKKLVVEYYYDAWGRLLSTTGTAASTLGINNPLRYRSYIYDRETGLYYLQSRYYNPTIGRFINADSFASTGQGVTGANMFAYCGNNPTKYEDRGGMLFSIAGMITSKIIEGVVERILDETISFLGDTFGAGSSSTIKRVKHETHITPETSIIPITTGMYTTETITQHGNASKPISVYANHAVENPIFSSSVGINAMINGLKLNAGLAMDDIGISGAIVDGNVTNAIRLKANLADWGKIGVELSTSVANGNQTQTTYTNVSINGVQAALVYVACMLGAPYVLPLW